MIYFNGVKLEFKTFPNGELRLDPTAVNENFKRYECINVVTFKYENDSDIFKLMVLKDYIDNELFYHRTSLLMPYAPYSRMDRSIKGQLFTLKTFTNIINSMNFEQVIILEPHSDVVTALLNNCKVINSGLDLLPKVEKEIEFERGFDYLFFPDAGAQKRYSSLKGYNQLVGYKDRDVNTGDIRSLEVVGNLPNNQRSKRRVLIIDDLCSYGGTFLHSGNKLKELGFKEIFLLVTHCENSIFEGKLLLKDSPIKKIFTTDSIISKNGVWTNKQYEDKIKIYNVEDLV